MMKICEGGEEGREVNVRELDAWQCGWIGEHSANADHSATLLLKITHHLEHTVLV